MSDMSNSSAASQTDLDFKVGQLGGELGGIVGLVAGRLKRFRKAQDEALHLSILMLSFHLQHLRGARTPFALEGLELCLFLRGQL